MARKIKIVCQYCGSDEVSMDGVCRWDVEAQQWVLTDTYDDCASCDQCCNETRLKEEEIEA